MDLGVRALLGLLRQRVRQLVQMAPVVGLATTALVVVQPPLELVVLVVVAAVKLVVLAITVAVVVTVVVELEVKIRTAIFVVSKMVEAVVLDILVEAVGLELAQMVPRSLVVEAVVPPG